MYVLSWRMGSAMEISIAAAMEISIGSFHTDVYVKSCTWKCPAAVLQLPK
jgi:hypothetical protein